MTMTDRDILDLKQGQAAIYRQLVEIRKQLDPTYDPADTIISHLPAHLGRAALGLRHSPEIDGPLRSVFR